MKLEGFEIYRRLMAWETKPYRVSFSRSGFLVFNASLTQALLREGKSSRVKINYAFDADKRLLVFWPSADGYSLTLTSKNRRWGLAYFRSPARRWAIPMDGARAEVEFKDGFFYVKVPS